MIQGHGGDIYAKARQWGCRPDDIIDMSSNINPLGMPPGLLNHLKEQLGTVGVLPEADGRTAIGQMAGLLDVDARCILAGSGTTQFIYTACSALESRKVMVVGPTYADYADACQVHGVEPRHFLTDARDLFEVHLGKLAEVIDGFDTVFICNPNNPTGRLIAHGPLVQLCRQNPGTHFIIDESYLPFVPRDQCQSMAAVHLDNVTVLWSLSKIFGVPGLRAGFLVAGEETVARFARYMQPWSLNSMAQAAVGWLGDNRVQMDAFIEQSRRFLEVERQSFCSGMGDIPSLTLIPSLVSYILMRLPDGLGAAEVCSRIGQNRFLIRNCSNFHGLTDQYVRVALKSAGVNRRALGLIANIIEG